MALIKQQDAVTAPLFSDVAEMVLNQCVNFEQDVDPVTGKPRLKSYEGRAIDLDFQLLEDEQAPWKKKSRLISASTFTQNHAVPKQGPGLKIKNLTLPGVGQTKSFFPSFVAEIAQNAQNPSCLVLILVV